MGVKKSLYVTAIVLTLRLLFVKLCWGIGMFFPPNIVHYLTIFKVGATTNRCLEVIL